MLCIKFHYATVNIKCVARPLDVNEIFFICLFNVIAL